MTQQHILFSLCLLLLASCARPANQRNLRPLIIPATLPTATTDAIPPVTAPRATATTVPATIVDSQWAIDNTQAPPPNAKRSETAGIPPFPTTTQPPDSQTISLNQSNTGLWQYPNSSFVHPIALAVSADTAYLLDAGRVIAFDLTGNNPPQTLLVPGDTVAKIPVLEPLDLIISHNSLLVLDRAGDVYRHDLTTQQWAIERYQRPSGETANHYYAALSGDSGYNFAAHRYLLEINYSYVAWNGTGRERLWNLPDGFGVDITAYNGRSTLLMHHPISQTNSLRQYENTGIVTTFQPALDIVQPREVLATDTAVYLLDHAGTRLTALHPDTGQTLASYQLPSDVSTFTHDGTHLIFAGRDRLYFYNQPQLQAFMAANITLPAPLPHDTAVLNTIPQFLLPIASSDLTTREVQMPGAPRHYRLGVHEGLDFYWQLGTPVRAVATGVVIRAMVDYERPSARDMEEWKTTTQSLGFSPESALDFYRGQQVWIQHNNGLITRYAHLSQISPGIRQGIKVDAGQLIGSVGNSGSPASIDSQSEDAHLHFEMWLGSSHYLGQYLRPIETREWVHAIFGNP